MVSKSQVIGFAVQAAIALWAGFFAYVWWGAPSPLRYPNEPFPVLTKKVKPGEYVETFVNRCNDTDDKLSYQIDRSLVAVDGSFRTNLITNTVSLAPGCQSTITRVSIIPEGTPPGIYVLEGMSTVKTRFKDYRLNWFTVPFEVVQ